MRVGRLVISQCIYEPVVLPIPAAAPAPSGCGDLRAAGLRIWRYMAVYSTLYGIPTSPGTHKPGHEPGSARTQHHAGGVSGDIGIFYICIWGATGGITFQLHPITRPYLSYLRRALCGRVELLGVILVAFVSAWACALALCGVAC